jgi:type III restriction enzyme
MSIKTVNSISGRLSLRAPQRESLEILHRITEIVNLDKDVDLNMALDAIKREYPTVEEFERDFVSLCFALATGVGKTRLMGAFISYLYLAHGLQNFFVLAPNLTIYNKLIADFTPNTPKYVFKGISEFAVEPPVVITGDNYEQGIGVRDQHSRQTRFEYGYGGTVHINIFNISKINSEVRGGKTPKMKRLSEYIGDSYFNYLAELKDLVLIMDESHRYRASAGIRAINELKPLIGLELTATPFVESSKGPIPFKNVIYDYPLRRAMDDGFVKEPAVVTQKDFNPAQFTPADIEKIKLEDGIHIHEDVKVQLSTYATQTEQKIVKPFLLVIARDTVHAAQLVEHIKSDEFFKGQYKEKVIQVDSSKTGAEEEEMITRLLAVESPDEPTEIVVHVNMLKEGWDVTNLYTIVPLRAANARTLIEQSIGRGLRLPYGRRTGVSAVDRLNIIAHDKFQEIVDEANRPDSAIQLKKVIIEPEEISKKSVAVLVPSSIDAKLFGKGIETAHGTIPDVPKEETAMFSAPEERRVAEIVKTVVKKYENLSTVYELKNEETQKQIIKETAQIYKGEQLAIPGTVKDPDFVKIVNKVTDVIVQGTIDIPRIVVIPKGEVTTGFHQFKLDVRSINYQPVPHEILIQYLSSHDQVMLSLGKNDEHEKRLEDNIVRALIDYDDIVYDETADLLYDLTGQLITHLYSYLKKEDAVKNVIQFYAKPLSQNIHAQMMEHIWEKAAGYEVKVIKGFAELKQCAFNASADKTALNFKLPVEERSKIGSMLFGGFERSLYRNCKFDSDTERRLSVIIDRDSQKWFRPLKGQFHIYYKTGGQSHEYQPDFVAETKNSIYLIEAKARNEMEAPEVLSKKDAAKLYCERATEHSKSIGGKPWKYLLIPHDVIADNMSLEGFEKMFGR